MNRRKFGWSALAIAVGGAVPLFAHEDFRIIGTITKVTSTKVDVKNKEGKSFSISMDKQTSVTRDKKKIAISGLKVGQSVVIDATGDSEKELLALEVRIVPTT
jgi:hypothetical protein